MSVPVWLIILSDQLPIKALVGHYLTNKLIDRGPLLKRLSSLIYQPNDKSHAELASVSTGCSPLEGRSPTCYSPIRH